MTSAAPSPLDGARLDSVNEDTIHALVHGFYDAVRRDDLIGPIFEREVAAGKWPVHLDKMCAFWSSLLLKTRRYQGRPLSPHLRIPELSNEHFQRWLSLFGATAAKVFNAQDAAAVTALAEKIAQSFRLSIAFQRGEDTTKLTPLSAGA
ncbi:MAG: group III truncated hemoglobin [Xanthobacteraceae bacterium]|nr:group III truncated hemoglobin [Xanthobacteraceae bacterium]MBX3534825.1 group III truncated hemoglobin [Xanthobacteraceae bacterium]MBX3548696.1 group III truncated hemoglobin [Xanthobacteraceae bacterium]MCW5673753.1 group III truncated hemoglobin [Xanthobacteraceae bacterium]MCW5678554.1 group III truncated hemoglobin [Xanthobacteraceae bacterium]